MEDRVSLRHFPFMHNSNYYLHNKMKKKKSKAGARKKDYAQKKHRLVIFIEGYKITAKGGEEKMKQHLYENAG